MKTLLFIIAVTTATSSLAQHIVSPEVQADGRITFRLKAPDAKAVRLNCEGIKESTLQKDDQGVWSFTSEPLEPDIYAYSFQVDGCRVIDPNNPFLKYNLLDTESQVRVPGPATLAWELNDVPRGQLHRHFYKSGVAGDDRDFYVYTPPGYNPASRKRYPVLYLLHGFSDDATAWTGVGMAHVILDNLIARKQAEPMIIVMPLGYGTMDVVRAGWGGVRSRDLWKTNVDKFHETLLAEVMPMAEQMYRISPDRKNHAITGLSMGGSESLMVGLNALDKFAWVGAFSSGGLGTNFVSQFPNLNQANAKLRLLWIACGQQDGLLAVNQQFVDWLKAQNIRCTWVPTPGQHSFRVWRRYLAEFVPLLFRP